MKEIKIFNYYQVLRHLPDSYLHEQEYDQANSPKSYLTWVDYSIEYRYVASNHYYYYQFSVENFLAIHSLLNFLHSKSIEIKCDGRNVLEQITNLAAFHEDFLKYFSNTSVILSNNGDDSGQASSSDKDSDNDSSSDISEDNPYLDMEIELVDQSKVPYTHLE